MNKKIKVLILTGLIVTAMPMSFVKADGKINVLQNNFSQSEAVVEVYDSRKISDFKLVKNGGLIDNLKDEYKATHKLQLTNITDNNTGMLINFRQTGLSKNADTKIKMKFFSNNNSQEKYIVEVDFKIPKSSRNYDYKLMAGIPKRLFEDQQYIYIQAEIYNSGNGTKFSDSVKFKVVNPYYSKYQQNGWVEKSGKKYYYKNGILLKNQWLNLSGKYYYLNSDGSMATGWKKVSGKDYYMDKNGVRQVSKWIGDYYVGKDGACYYNK